MYCYSCVYLCVYPFNRALRPLFSYFLPVGLSVLNDINWLLPPPFLVTFFPLCQNIECSHTLFQSCPYLCFILSSTVRYMKCSPCPFTDVSPFISCLDKSSRLGSFTVKDQTVNIVGFVCHIHLCSCCSFFLLFKIENIFSL